MTNNARLRPPALHCIVKNTETVVKKKYRAVLIALRRIIFLFVCLLLMAYDFSQIH